MDKRQGLFHPSVNVRKYDQGDKCTQTSFFGWTGALKKKKTDFTVERGVIYHQEKKLEIYFKVKGKGTFLMNGREEN